MSTRERLRDIEEQKSLLVAKADLQRSTLLMIVSPVLRVVRTAEMGVFAARTGRALMQRISK